LELENFFNLWKELKEFFSKKNIYYNYFKLYFQIFLTIQFDKLEYS
jgi:hypothetical protein